MTEEALNRGLVRSLYFSVSGEKEYAGRLSGYGREVPSEILSDRLFSELTDTVTPQGVLSVVEMPQYDRKQLVYTENAALFRVPFFFCEEITTDVELLKKEGFTIYAAHPRGQRIFTEETYAGRVGILIGNEANGLSEELSNLADKRVRIPMEGQLESLNAAVSAALFMYEVHRNRR